MNGHIEWSGYNAQHDRYWFTANDPGSPEDEVTYYFRSEEDRNVARLGMEQTTFPMFNGQVNPVFLAAALECRACELGMTVSSEQIVDMVARSVCGASVKYVKELLRNFMVGFADEHLEDNVDVALAFMSDLRAGSINAWVSVLTPLFQDESSIYSLAWKSEHEADCAVQEYYDGVGDAEDFTGTEAELRRMICTDQERYADFRMFLDIKFPHTVDRKRKIDKEVDAFMSDARKFHTYTEKPEA